MGQRNVSGFEVVVVVAMEGEIQKDKKEDYLLLRNLKTMFSISTLSHQGTQ